MVESSTAGHGQRDLGCVEDVWVAVVAVAVAVDGRDEVLAAHLMMKPAEEEVPLLLEVAAHGESLTWYDCR